MADMFEPGLPLVLGNPIARNMLARAREGRIKALAAVRRNVVVSCIAGDALHRRTYRYQPTVQDLVETLGAEAVVIGVELHRLPSKDRPRLLA
jgi:hypothetical protein